MTKDITESQRVRNQFEKDFRILSQAAKLLDRPPPKMKDFVDEDGVWKWVISCNLKGVLTYEFCQFQDTAKSSE